jgi:formate hydrogenlyase subunit 3/multisubunit Na+/H+ antiporter MnhD subunit
MPAVSHQMSLIGATCLLLLAVVGIVSQSRSLQEKRNGLVYALSWGTLILSLLMILSNDAFALFILNELTKLQGL